MSLLLALLFAVGTPQATPPSNPSPTPEPPSQAAPVQAGYIIGAQDLLTITVFNEQDLTNKYRVDSDGMVTFPLIGRVPAAGLTLVELQDRIQSALASGYIRNPQVRVEIDQYKSQSVYVIGEVRSPGKITMTGEMKLIEALALAGSPTASASNELIVVHPKKPRPAGAATLPGEDDAVTTRVNIKDLQVGKAGQDVVLQDGDTLFVPKAQTFYITGQVRNPGSYVLDPGMTVLQAISLAGGLNDRGSDRGIKAIRVVDGKRKEVDVELADPVQANDTIQVRQRFF